MLYEIFVFINYVKNEISIDKIKITLKKPVKFT
ncbi:MAG: hypothetical protein BWY70_01851 [Bacteroidetes bacterium ADurb.Bin408]|nr:MAG: hypothetical protein BWY70_01851 [Bacteroidetes bacterium ADurb.Bin408]